MAASGPRSRTAQQSAAAAFPQTLPFFGQSEPFYVLFWGFFCCISPLCVGPQVRRSAPGFGEADGVDVGHHAARSWQRRAAG